MGTLSKCPCFCCYKIFIGMLCPQWLKGYTIYKQRLALRSLTTENGFSKVENTAKDQKAFTTNDQ